MVTRRAGARRHFLDAAEWDEHGTATATVSDVICRELEKGLPGEMAAKFAGANYATYRDWLVDGRRMIRNSQLDPSWQPDPEDVLLMEFCQLVSQAQARWVQRTNEVLDAMQYSRRKVSVRVKTEVLRDSSGAPVLDEHGNPREIEAERIVTTTDEPIDATPILWRLGKVAPSVYGPAPRYEQEDAEGQSETIDVAKRVEELLARVADVLVIAPEEPDV